MPSSPKRPKFGSAVFCTGVTFGDHGKLSCSNVFTTFLAWGYPTSIKTWHAIVTIYDLPEGTSSVSVTISHRKLKRSEKVSLSTSDVKRIGKDVGCTLSIQLSYVFPKEGDYIVVFNLVGTTVNLKIPLRIATQIWPELNQKEISALRENPSLARSIRAIVTCSNCSRPYTFEETFLPDATLADGVLPFPPSGKLECESCGTTIYLKDLQGQVRSSVKTAVQAFLKGGK